MKSNFGFWIGDIGLKAVVGAALLSGAVARADDWPMWGRTPDRHMISPEKNPPTDWEVPVTRTVDGKEVEVKPGKNIKWHARLGSQSYANPVISRGLVFTGTNNEGKRDPKIDADGGVLMVFNESDGKFLYQRFSPKLKAGRVNDWPYQGVCATAYCEGDLMWYCTNRCEVVCLDVSPLRYGKTEPNTVWSFDMMEKLGVFPHNMTSCSITSYEDYIYVITANGVDESHKNIPNPKAPGLVCFNKKTGAVVWTRSDAGENVLHSQWASPSIATVNGRVMVIAPLGDAWLYGYDAKTGEQIFKCDLNLKDTVYPTTRNECIATPCIVDNKYCYIANGQDPEHGEGIGHLWCIDITKTGDISLELDDRPKPKPGDELLDTPSNANAIKPNPNSGVVWHFAEYDLNKDGKIQSVEQMHRTISTCVVADGLVFAPDFSGFLHCLDAKTGQVYWNYDMEAAVWGSPLVCDGKVYQCDEDGDVAIFELSKDMKLIATHNMGSPVYCSPVFANGVLYIQNRETLFAIEEKK